MNRAAAVLLRQDFIGKLKGLGAEEIRKREKENSIPYEDTLKEYMHSPDHIHKFCLWCRPEDWEAVCATVPGWGAVVQQSAPTDGKIRNGDIWSSSLRAAPRGRPYAGGAGAME